MDDTKASVGAVTEAKPPGAARGTIFALQTASVDARDILRENPTTAIRNEGDLLAL
jgi:hypothetical protein